MGLFDAIGNLIVDTVETTTKAIKIVAEPVASVAETIINEVDDIVVSIKDEL